MKLNFKRCACGRFCSNQWASCSVQTIRAYVSDRFHYFCRNYADWSFSATTSNGWRENYVDSMENTWSRRMDAPRSYHFKLYKTSVLQFLVTYKTCSINNILPMLSTVAMAIGKVHTVSSMALVVHGLVV